MRFKGLCLFSPAYMHQYLQYSGPAEVPSTLPEPGSAQYHVGMDHPAKEHRP
jgi:hypothetical protein